MPAAASAAWAPPPMPPQIRVSTPPGLQQSGQSAVSLPVCAQHPGFGDAAVLHGVQFELFGAAEMLEDAAVFVSYCDFHTGWSFLLYVEFLGMRGRYRPPDTIYKKDS